MEGSITLTGRLREVWVAPQRAGAYSDHGNCTTTLTVRGVLYGR